MNTDQAEKVAQEPEAESESDAIFVKLKELLDSKGIEYKLMEHKPGKTSEEVAEIRGTPLQTGAKAMIIKLDKDFIMIVIPANKKFNSKAAKKALNSKNLRFAETSELKSLTGCLTGGVPPFGSLFGLPTYVDQTLLSDTEYDYISFNGGLRSKSFILSKEFYKAIENPNIITIC